MKCCIMRKVAYRLPGGNRIAWAMILAEREGLTLLYVPRTHDVHSHKLVLAAENVAEGVFEDVNASQFPLENSDLVDIASKLHALGGDLSESDFRKLFDVDDW